jgi:hypothetical protein
MVTLKESANARLSRIVVRSGNFYVVTVCNSAGILNREIYSGKDSEKAKRIYAEVA